ncbi:hypothetical protein JCM4914_07150 [Streptomyces platensis subsp. malvinus]
MRLRYGGPVSTWGFAFYRTDPSICPRTTHDAGSTINPRKIYGADHLGGVV